MDRTLLVKRVYKAISKDATKPDGMLELQLFQPTPMLFGLTPSLKWQVGIEFTGIEKFDSIGPGIDAFQALEVAMTIASSIILGCTEKYQLMIQTDENIEVDSTVFSADLSSVSLIAGLMAAAGSGKH